MEPTPSTTPCSSSSSSSPRPCISRSLWGGARRCGRPCSICSTTNFGHRRYCCTQYIWSKLLVKQDLRSLTLYTYAMLTARSGQAGQSRADPRVPAASAHVDGAAAWRQRPTDAGIIKQLTFQRGTCCRAGGGEGAARRCWCVGGGAHHTGPNGGGGDVCAGEKGVCRVDGKYANGSRCQ